MPLYEFECEKCMQRFEVRRSFNDNSEVDCPLCSGETRRIYSPAPIIFKGSGFYVTDVKRAGDRSYKQAAEKAQESTSTPAADKTKESIPAPAAEKTKESTPAPAAEKAKESTSKQPAESASADKK